MSTSIVITVLILGFLILYCRWVLRKKYDRLRRGYLCDGSCSECPMRCSSKGDSQWNS